MLETFLNLPKEKQRRIQNAAMKEFAENGFKNASTDRIAAEANISKGALFHYFGTKKGLFLYLYDYSIEIVANQLYCTIDMSETDMFRRLRQVAQVKLEMFNQHPDLTSFLMAAHLEDAKAVQGDIQARMADLTEHAYSKVLKGFDLSKFREGVDVARATEIVTWTIKGFTDQEIAKAKALPPPHTLDFEKLFAEADLYLELLKKCFYR